MKPRKVCNIASKEMESLPSLKDISKEFSTNWSGALLVDGKYIKVKGYKNKIPYIYAVDYLTHDIPAGLLAHSESISSFERLFSQIQEIEYPLSIVIGDDSEALKRATDRRFPGIPFQLCQTHYLENVRKTLGVRTDDTYLPFFLELKTMFEKDIGEKERIEMLKKTRKRHTDIRSKGILIDFWNHYQELFAYERVSGDVPHSNNLIECYNSHVNGRLKTIKGFDCFSSAERWMSAWMIRRRTKPLTDCGGKFKKLNGKCPIEHSMKSGVNLEDISRFLGM